MNDEELIEMLRRTLRARAASIRPNPSAVGARTAPKVTRPWRQPRLLATVGAAAAVLGGALAAGITLSGPTHTSLTVDTQTPATSVATPTTVNATVPAPSSTTTTVPGGAPVSPGFEPMSVTFVSMRTGWALGSLPCGNNIGCAEVAKTTDGSVTWSQVGRPTLKLAGQPAQIRFANLSDGWIYGTEPGASASMLFSTQDGGQTWDSIADPAGNNAMILDIEVSNGVAHLVAAVPGTGQERVYDSTVANGQWNLSPVNLRLGGGPVPQAQVVLDGSGGWILDLDRTVLGGAVLAPGGGWTRWNGPCMNANGTGFLAAASQQNLVAACNEGVWGPPAPGTTVGKAWLFTSKDGGSSFVPAGEIPGGAAAAVTSPPEAATTVVVGGPIGLEATFDGGKSWQQVDFTPDITFVGFTTATQGVAIAAPNPADGKAAMLMTRDGGATWSPVNF